MCTRVLTYFLQKHLHPTAKITELGLLQG